MKKVVLFAALEETLINNLKKVKDHLELRNAEVHLVTCHHVQVYMADLVVYSYPTEDQRPELEEASDRILTSLANEMELENFQVHTIFDSDPKDRAKKFLEDLGADIAVISTRKEKGIFESSFANYMNNHSPCAVLVLK